MDMSSSAGKLLLTLKEQLRSKSLHYHDVAVRLKVSEGTIKRYFSGRGVDINVLDRLAQIVGLDLLSLAAMAQQQNATEPGLTKAQRAALKRSRPSIVVLYYLSIGFTPAQLIQEFDLAEQIETILRNLEEWGLIRRLSSKSVSVLVKLKSGKLDEETRTGRIKQVRRFLSEINLRDEECEWAYYYARLSPATAVRLKELMKRLQSDVNALTKSEIHLPPNETQWYRLFVGAEQASRREMFR